MINAICIQSHSKEIKNNRLDKFLSKNNSLFNTIDIPIFLFIDNNNKINSTLNQNIQVVNFIECDNATASSNTTNAFKYMMNFQVEKYNKILLLETDCVLKNDFLSKINDDIQNYDFWIYGSYYYGKAELRSEDDKKHMNGVAVYNRNNQFLKYVNAIDSNGGNYDMRLTWMLKRDNLFFEKTVNSKYILNLTSHVDIDIQDYENYKPEWQIVHTKRAFLY